MLAQKNAILSLSGFMESVKFLWKGSTSLQLFNSARVDFMKYMKFFFFLAFVILLPLRADSETLIYSYDAAGRLTGAGLNYGVDIAYFYDATGNRLDRIIDIAESEPGDINNDGLITLDDFILASQTLSGIRTETPVFSSSDINGNNQIDLADTIWILRNLAGL